jgi:hypothetical protein
MIGPRGLSYFQSLSIAIIWSVSNLRLVCLIYAVDRRDPVPIVFISICTLPQHLHIN